MIGMTSVSAAMMEKSITSLYQRGQLVVNNIANEDTPGYKAKRLEFESLMRKEMDRQNSVTAFDREQRVASIQSLSPRVYEDATTTMRADGNNVDMDAENIELARVQMQIDALTRKISGHYSLLKYAVTGGR